MKKVPSLPVRGIAEADRSGFRLIYQGTVTVDYTIPREAFLQDLVIERPVLELLINSTRSLGRHDSRTVTYGVLVATEKQDLLPLWLQIMQANQLLNSDEFLTILRTDPAIREAATAPVVCLPLDLASEIKHNQALPYLSYGPRDKVLKLHLIGGNYRIKQRGKPGATRFLIALKREY